MFNESFWLAIGFVIFVYFIYRPLKKSILAGLDKKIGDIRSQIVAMEKVKEDATELLAKSKENIANLPVLRQEIIEEGEHIAQKLFNERLAGIEQTMLAQKVQFTSALDSKYYMLSEQLKSELLEDVVHLVTAYLKNANNNSLSDVKIAKMIRISK